MLFIYTYFKILTVLNIFDKKQGYYLQEITRGWILNNAQCSNLTVSLCSQKTSVTASYIQKQ
jgi:hypothetical protein